ncbi:hypothetical protein Emag_006597 [Eimeria magna]
MDPSSLLLTIGYEPCPGRTETHLLRLSTEDELNSRRSKAASASAQIATTTKRSIDRKWKEQQTTAAAAAAATAAAVVAAKVEVMQWHHALAYAGFIRIGPVAQQPSVIPSIQLSSEPPSTPREEMLVSVSVPGAIGFDGAPTLSERHNAYAHSSPSLFTLRDAAAFAAAAAAAAAAFAAAAAYVFVPVDIVPLIIPCSSVEMASHKDSNSISFTSVEDPDKTVIISTQDMFFLELLGVVGSGSYHRAPPKKEAPVPAPPPPHAEAKPKPPTPPQQSPRQTDENDLFVIRDGNLMLFEKAGDEQPILKLHNTDCVTQADAGSREFVITHMGCLELYKDYGTPDAKPVIVLMADRCSAKASRERREIRILHTSPTGKRERITLDCASLAEFDRWDVALHFGNFLKGEGVAGKGSQTYANLSKYVFPINLFEDASGRRSALLIENRALLLFATPDATEPILTASADECEVQPVISQRKLRVYINRNTKREQRVDFILALAKDFDRYVAACQRDSFPEAVVGRPVEKLAIPFVLCRKGLMAVYKSKFHAHAELTFEVTKYTLTEDGPVYVFISNDNKDTARRVTVTSPDSRTRWEFAIKLAGFKSFSKTPPPRFFFPQIIYGFVAEEASELRKDSFLGSARAAFGRLQMPREKAHSPDGGVETPKSLNQ